MYRLPRLTAPPTGRLPPNSRRLDHPAVECGRARIPARDRPKLALDKGAENEAILACRIDEFFVKRARGCLHLTTRLLSVESGPNWQSGQHKCASLRLQTQMAALPSKPRVIGRTGSQRSSAFSWAHIWRSH